MIRKIGKNGVLFFVVLVTAVCVPAEAVLLTNGSTTIVEDGFEDYTVGVAPPSPWVAGIAPGTAIGGKVDNVSPPGAYEGSKYLELHRLGLGVPGESVIFTPQTSGTVKLTFMASTGSAGVYGGFIIKDAASGAGFQVVFQGHTTYIGGAGVYIWDGSGLQSLGLGWTDGVWKKVEFEYTMGASAATIKVDGGAAVPFNSLNSLPVSSLGRLDFFVPSTYDSELNIDAENPVTERTATPAFDPDGGTFIRGPSVTISCDTPGATIRYTTDGTEPAADGTTGVVYTGPVAIPDIQGATTTLKARAFATGLEASFVKTAMYTVTHERLIAYADFDNDTAGQNPSAANIQVTAGRTAFWQIFKPAPYPEDIQVIDDSMEMGNKVLRMDYPDPAGAIEKVLLHLSKGVGVEDLAPGEVVRTSFKFRFMDTWPLPEDSFMGYWALGDNATGNRHGCGIMYNSAAYPGFVISSGNTGAGLLGTGQVVNRWYLVERIITLNSDPNTPNTFIGVITDLVTGATDSNANPSALQYYEHSGELLTVSGMSFDSTTYNRPAHLEFDELTIEIDDPPADTPTFDPDGGTYVEPQSVTISCATPEATIRYTTDGSDPAADGSTGAVYTGPVDITSTMTLKARAFAPNHIASGVESAYYFMARPMPIPPGSVTVDGNLSDWSDVTWAPLDQNYYQTAPDVTQAYYAAKWTADKLYVAVKVQDTTQTLTPTRVDWDSADCVEIYVHTTGSYPDPNNLTYFPDQVAAQQYTVGIRSDDTNAVWSIIGDNHAILPAYGFTVAGKKNLTWLQYEMAITPYETFDLSGVGLVVSPLSVGQVIGVDVVADSRYGVGAENFGMKSENLLLDKYAYYEQIALHKLGSEPVCGDPQHSYPTGDLNEDCYVDRADFGIFASQWLAGGCGDLEWCSGADLNQDTTVNLQDFTVFAANWLDCTDPQPPCGYNP